MKILQVIGSLDRGGAETWLVQLLHHIDRERYCMDFLVHTAVPGAYDEEIKALGARVIPCLPRLGDGKPLEYALNFRRVLREYGPYDCVHSHIHHSSGFVLMLAAMMRVPIRIAHSHNDTRSIDKAMPVLPKAYFSVMDALIRQFSTAGIAVGKNSAPSLFSDSWSSDPRWRVCSLGIDLRPFTENIDRRRVRAELSIPQESFVVGHVGRFAEQKNHRFLVDIAENLCRTEPRAVFLLVGDGPLKPQIENLVRERRLDKHFIFAGVRNDVPRIMMGAMDSFLFPSFYEGLGLVVWEAQAAGLNCVISDAVPIEADIVTELVRRLSLDIAAEVWADELRRISAQPHIPVVSAGLKLADFSIDASAARLMGIYDLCMQNAESGAGASTQGMDHKER